MATKQLTETEFQDLVNTAVSKAVTEELAKKTADLEKLTEKSPEPEDTKSLKLEENPIKRVNFNPTVKEFTRDEKILHATKFLIVRGKSYLTGRPMKDVAESIALRTKSVKDEAIVEAIKALSISEYTSGGALIPENFVEELIPYLDKYAPIMGAISNRIDMPGGSAIIPKATGTVTMYWMDENEDITTSEPTFGDIRLNAHKGGISVPINNDLLEASTMIESLVQNMMLTRMGAGIDNKLLYGVGTQNTIKGLYYQGHSANRFNSAGTTEAYINADLNDAIEKVESHDILVTGGKFIMSTQSKNYLNSVTTTSKMYAFKDDIRSGNLIGYPLLVTNNVSNAKAAGNVAGAYSQVFFADFDKLVLGIQNQMKVQVIPYAAYNSGSSVISGASRDQTLFNIIVSLDFSAYYEEAIAVIENVNWK